MSNTNFIKTGSEVNNSINMNKTNYLSLYLNTKRGTTIYDIENPSLELVQTQNSGGVNSLMANLAYK